MDEINSLKQTVESVSILKHALIFQNVLMAMQSRASEWSFNPCELRETQCNLDGENTQHTSSEGKS